MDDEGNQNEGQEQSAPQENANQPEQSDVRIDQIIAAMQSMQEQVSAMQSSMAMFVEGGGTIREGDMQPANVGSKDDFEYVPIDDLDLF